MGDAAHVEPSDHEVYRTPLAVKFQAEEWNTPDNYRESFLGPGKLPDKVKVWRVQSTDKDYGGVVARSRGFGDSPDTEVLAAGFNRGKEYGAIGIGRHGNFLQWGYSASPSQMTEPGKALFVNCIHYIRRFDGKAPLVRAQSSDRLYAVYLAGIVNRIQEDKREEFFSATFPKEIYNKYKSDPNGLTQYYQTSLEWVYHDRVFRVDEDLKALGIESNRKLSTLERLISMLDDPSKATAAQTLLSRYTRVSFDTPQQWRQWFDANRDRIFFTDVGGYKFVVVPEGYLTPHKDTAPSPDASGGR
jgi:hypothetical protein